MVGTSALPPGTGDVHPALRSFGPDWLEPAARKWGGRVLVLCPDDGGMRLVAQVKLPGPVHAVCLCRCPPHLTAHFDFFFFLRCAVTNPAGRRTLIVATGRRLAASEPDLATGRLIRRVSAPMCRAVSALTALPTTQEAGIDAFSACSLRVPAGRETLIVATGRRLAAYELDLAAGRLIRRASAPMRSAVIALAALPEAAKQAGRQTRRFGSGAHAAGLEQGSGVGFVYDADDYAIIAASDGDTSVALYAYRPATVLGCKLEARPLAVAAKTGYGRQNRLCSWQASNLQPAVLTIAPLGAGEPAVSVLSGRTA